MTMLTGMVLTRLFGVMYCVVGVPLGDVRMITGGLMTAKFMMLGCGAMVLGRMFMMLCCFPMVFGGFFGHVTPPWRDAWVFVTRPMLIACCEAAITLALTRHVLAAVTPLQESTANIVYVLQALRVTSMFLAQERDREPLHMETFRAGELLFALSSEDGYTVFCRYDEAANLDDRPQFEIADEDFQRLTIPV